MIGAGHNGLVCAAYLARHGLPVAVLERRARAGGCAGSERVMSTTVNICNCDHTLIRASGVIDELDLHRHGLSYFDLSPSRQHFVPGGRPWWAWHDIAQTLDGLAVTHPGEVAGYRRYLEDLLPLAQLVVEVGIRRPGWKSLGVAQGGGSTGPLPWRNAGRLAHLRRDSAARVLARYFSSEDLRAPAAAGGPAIWGLAPDLPGTGLGALGYALGHLVSPGRPLGGSGALVDALVSAVTLDGGTVRCGAEVVSIDCSEQAVHGVTLASGEEVEADVVVCASDPRRAVVRWLRHPPRRAGSFVRRWARMEAGEGYESKVDAVIEVPPRLADEPDGLRARLGVPEDSATTLVVTPPTDAIVTARALASRGQVAPQPIMLANVPDLADRSVAPLDGGHTFSLEVLFTPWALRGGWENSNEPARWLEVFGQLQWGDFLSGIRRWRSVTPRDYHDEYGLERGYAPSYPGGALATLVGLGGREVTRYRTPVPGLYLTGAGTFPGAGVWGASGRNAAGTVLSDLATPRRYRLWPASG